MAVYKYEGKRGVTYTVDYYRGGGPGGHCNAALGSMRDNPEIARRMAEYLEKHSDDRPHPYEG